MKKFLCLLATAILAIGCQPDSGDNDVNQPSDKPVGPSGYTSLSISLDSTSRTTLGSRDENFTYSVQWSEEDQIAVNGTPSEKVEIDAEKENACHVTVPDTQLSLAIGNKGQNARLAARLTGWKIDIKPESGFYIPQNS
jgi:hypothetical protein